MDVADAVLESNAGIINIFITTEDTKFKVYKFTNFSNFNYNFMDNNIHKGCSRNQTVEHGQI